MLERISEFVEERTQSFFYSLGLWIAGCPKLCISFVLALTVILIAGIQNFREQNNVREHFSADDSPSRYEYAVGRDFFKEFGDPFHVVVAMQANDGGSLLRPQYLDKALEIEEFLQYKLNVTHEGKTYSYSDFCGSHCETSDAVHIFLSMYRDVKIRKKATVKLTYPTMDLFGNRIYLANNIFQVDLDNRSNLINGCRLVAINFHAIITNESMGAMMKKWEDAVFAFSESTIGASLIRVYATSEGLVSAEVRQTGFRALPLMSVSVIVVLLFTVLTTLKKDPVRSKPWEAALGVFSPILAVCAAFGMLFWLNFAFLPIVSVVPFLILAIGVDDVFIFLYCYDRTNPKLPVKERIARMLAEAGPSITITSLTNFLSFAISAFTPTPAIQVFSIFISVSVVFDYVYQIFFFSAVLTLSGYREEKHMNAYIPCIKVRKNELKKISDHREATFTRVLHRVVDIWVDVSLSTYARVMVVVFLIVYWAFSAYGITQMKVGLTSEKLFMDNSPLLPFVRLQTSVIFKEGGQVVVFINNPGDLRKPERIPRIMKLLDKMEHATGSVGSVSTNMWLYPYLSYVGIQNHGDVAFDYKYLPEFFMQREYHRWSHFVSLGPESDCAMEKPSCVQKFFFATGFHDAVTWSSRLELLKEWRALLAEYSDLNATVYEPFSMYSDQLQVIVPVTKSTVMFAFICMAIVLLAFTPSPTTVITSTLSILSINLGIFGSLSYWHIDLDPISMATTLMAIGFSVDFIAHITFHYYKGAIADKRDRLHHALVSIAWPMTQAGLSTVLSLSVLAIINAYMVKVFVKVVVMVVSLGLLHGLVILPIIFGALPLSKPHVKKESTSMSSTNSSVSSVATADKTHSILVGATSFPAKSPDMNGSSGPRYQNSRG